MRSTVLGWFVAALALPIDCAAVAPQITCTGIWAPNTSEIALQRRFGSRVRSQKVDVGDGNEEEGAAIDPDKPQSTVFVLWKDSTWRRNPASIRIPRQSRQQTYSGIGIGTTLKDLERLNGAPFDLVGFDFDYSGTVTSWRDGRLARVGGTACELKVRLEPARSGRPSREEVAAIDATVGDHDFSSSDPNMQLLNPRVYEVLLIYR
jgi:hypothetical protein